jgi:hypothetical protein
VGSHVFRYFEGEGGKEIFKQKLEEILHIVELLYIKELLGAH